MENNLRLKGLSDDNIRKKFPDLIREIDCYLDKDCEANLKEKIWLYLNKLKNIPLCGNDGCGNLVKFIKFSQGFRKYCSKKCSAIQSNKDDYIRKSRIVGFEKSNKDSELRKLMTQKANRTKEEFSDGRKMEIIEKRKKTNLIKWGVENISHNLQIREEISKKLKLSIPRYKLEKTKQKIKNQNKFEIIEISDDLILRCKKCLGEFKISRSLFNQRGRFDINQCLVCNPINNNSNFENEVYEFISENYKGLIYNKYKKFKKYEIDIYLPDIKIGIECNGLWWHSDEYKDKKYHIEKSDFFLKEGIRIIHVWEDDWKFKREIIKSKLRNLIIPNQNKIWARNCALSEVDSITSKKFLDENHLQGSINSKYRIGLFLKNELVCLMTFGDFRRNLGRKKVEKNYELYRFCSKGDLIVVGGASKLLKYFISNFNPQKIISYASRDWSGGNLYEKIGFSLVKQTDPNYHYFHKDEGIRKNRFGFRKDKLIKDGFDPNLTEIEIMYKRGYRRIYDTGSLLYEMKLINDNN